MSLLILLKLLSFDLCFIFSSLHSDHLKLMVHATFSYGLPREGALLISKEN